MSVLSCAFVTERLSAVGWHACDAVPTREALRRFVVDLMTDRVTRDLPSEWQGEYTEGRADDWVEQRDAESTVLLVTERAFNVAVGLLILTEIEAEVRFGYVLHPDHSGRGLATELLKGLVDWSRGEPGVLSLAGGVTVDNAASARVLEKNGFTRVESEPDGGCVYRLGVGSAGALG